MIQSIKYGQNTSYDSRDRVQASFFWSNLTKCWCHLENEVKATKILSFLSHISLVFLCKFGQNPPIGLGDRVQTRLIFTVFIVWWPWKLGQGHQNLTNPFIIPMIQSIKYGQNTSFDSRDRVLTSFFRSKLDIFKVLVWPWKWARSPKSNHFFPMSQWCFYASFVKIHQLVQETECRHGSF